MKNQKIFLNNEWTEKERACINVYDHGILYGDGIYEGMRAYNGNIFKLDEHLLRMRRSAKSLCLDIPYTDEDLRGILYQGLRVNDLRNAYFRVILTRGEGSIGPDPSSCTSSKLIVIVEDIPPLHGPNNKGIRTALAVVRRTAIDSATAQIKSLNYLNSVLGKIEAKRMGVDDVIMLNDKGFIAEAPVANIFIVQGKSVITPNKSSGILDGITRRSIIEIMTNQGNPVIETDVTPYDLTISDEIFLCGTHAEIVPVIEHNSQSVGKRQEGTITSMIRKEFDKMIRGI